MGPPVPEPLEALDGRELEFGFGAAVRHALAKAAQWKRLILSERQSGRRAVQNTQMPRHFLDVASVNLLLFWEAGIGFRVIPDAKEVGRLLDGMPRRTGL